MNRMAEPGYLRRLSEFVCGATLEDTPAEVVDRGRWIIADCLGAIAIGAQAQEMKRLVRRMLPPKAGGRASLVGCGRTADPLLAALINGSAGTWLELDECNLAAKGHPAIQVVPAAVAVAEENGAAGKDLLLAVILGYEACARIGRAARMRPALHPHGTYGTIGAAIAVAVLKGYGPADLRRLINISATLGLATSRRAVFEGATVRNVYAGMSGHMGVLADRLAQSGFTAEADGVGSIYGSVYGEAFDADLVVRDIGREFLIAGSCFKRYPCAIQIQSPLDLVGEVMAGRPGGIDANDLERVDVRSYAHGAALSHRSVTNSFGARYSIPFAVASLIHHGRPGLENFEEKAVADPAIRELAERVDVGEDADYTARYPDEQPCTVRLHFKDGTDAEATTAYTKGEAEKPYSPEELKDKFFGLASRVWEGERAEAIFVGCMSLEHVRDVRTLLPAPIHPAP